MILRTLLALLFLFSPLKAWRLYEEPIKELTPTVSYLRRLNMCFLKDV